MDVTVSLPDDMRQRARTEGLNLSKLLRDVVTAEFDRRDAMRQSINEPQTYEVDLETPDGRGYIGRIVGRLIHEGYGQALYLTTDARVLFVGGGDYDVLGAEEPIQKFLHDWLRDSPDEYVAACEKLGLKPVVDL